jgi:hypothetical protein
VQKKSIPENQQEQTCELKGLWVTEILICLDGDKNKVSPNKTNTNRAMKFVADPVFHLK